MKRDRRLRDLSDDHHQALVLARRATRAAAGDTATSRCVWDEVVRRFANELEPHFAIEEQCLLPALARSGRADLARRTRDEHAALRQLVIEDQTEIASRLARFGRLLRDHVRFEERVLFAVIQETLDDAALDVVGDACRSRKSGPHPDHRTAQP